MNNKKYFWGILTSVVLLLGLFGYWGWRYYFIACCEPPIELRALVENQKTTLSGNWVYFNQDVAGYSTGVVINLNHSDQTVTGDFSVVWSFPNAPAARIDTGTFRGTAVSGQLARIDWTGDREDSGTAELSFDPSLDTLEWKAVTSTKSDVTMPDALVLHRNRWGQMDRGEQTVVIEAAGKALAKMPTGSGMEISIEDIQVVKTRAAVPFLNAEGESAGTIYLGQQENDWVVIPDLANGDLSSGL